MKSKSKRYSAQGSYPLPLRCPLPSLPPSRPTASCRRDERCPLGKNTAWLTVSAGNAWRRPFAEPRGVTPTTSMVYLPDSFRDSRRWPSRPVFAPETSLLDADRSLHGKPSSRDPLLRAWVMVILGLPTRPAGDTPEVNAHVGCVPMALLTVGASEGEASPSQEVSKACK